MTSLKGKPSKMMADERVTSPQSDSLSQSDLKDSLTKKISDKRQAKQASKAACALKSAQSDRIQEIETELMQKLH